MTEAWFTVRWRDNSVELIDQRLLPGDERYLVLESVEEVARAIEDLAVRGAPAIGCTAALGIALAAVRSAAVRPADLVRDLDAAAARLARTRPTAVNLFWAIDQLRTLWIAKFEAGDEIDQIRDALVVYAQRLVADDVEICRSIGRVGLEVIPDGSRVLTHCNAGGLATAGYGTALGVVRAAVEAGRSVEVFADETRPFLQGARLTAWELQRDRIPVTVITDNMAGYLMQCGEVDLVVVGADRIAANGDVANKIGTYTVAVLAREHGIPFYVAAPMSTIDFDTPDGASIPIEERGRDEVAKLGSQLVLPDGVPVRHPAFDVTPAEWIAAIVTDRGLVRAPYRAGLQALREQGV